MRKKSKDDNLTTQNRLLEAAIKQFALYGFEKTTTRSIVLEADANLSSISFHYDSKEKLYEAALRHIVASSTAFQKKLFAEIDAVEAEGLLTPDMAWNYISALVDSIIEWNFNAENFYGALFMKREALFPSEAFKDVAAPLLVVYRYMEKLFLVYTGSNDRFWAAGGSYFCLGSIFSHSNFPKLMKEVLRTDCTDPGVAAAIKAGLKSSVLTAIKAILQSKKDFGVR